MKIEVYSRVEKHARKPARFSSNNLHNVVRLELDDGSVIDIEPIGNYIEIRETDGRTLTITPVGANNIQIHTKPHW